MMQLRDYQKDAVDATFEYWRTKRGNPLLVIPTGGGKTLCIAEIVRRCLEMAPLMRIAVLAPQAELIKQGVQTMMRHMPSAPVGVFSASLGKRQRSQVMYATVQSVYSKIDMLGAFDLFIVDEAHTITRSGQGRYEQMFEDNTRHVKHWRCLGLTATPYRVDSGRLERGDGALFTDVAYEVEIVRLLNAGHLCPLRPAKIAFTGYDLSGVKKSGGDYVETQLAAAVNTEDNNLAAVREIVEFSPGRKAILVFCSDIDHAETVAAMLTDAGIRTEAVHGKLPAGRRADLIEQFKSGRLRALTNVNVLTTGFDYPSIDMLAFMRPTMSPGLYVQMAGRGLRQDGIKSECLVLDFAKLVDRHGPIDDIKPPAEKRKKDSDLADTPPHWECEGCGHLNHLKTRVCAGCGVERPPSPGGDQTPIEATSGEREIIGAFEKVRMVDVADWVLYRHEKPGKPDSLRICYLDGLLEVANEWLPFEYPAGSAPRNKAVDVWLKLGGQWPAPNSADEAIERRTELRRPKRIGLVRNGKFEEVMQREFE